MQFRRAKSEDMGQIMGIIKEAQDYFKEQEIDQWQNNYPNPEIIQKDIDNADSYVLVKDDVIVGTVAVVFGKDPFYEEIAAGQWQSEEDYGAIHRIAISSHHKGLGLSSIMMKHIEEICSNRDIHHLRGDTHRDNISMQKMLKKNGFVYRGIVYVEDGAERIAFEKAL